MKFDIKNRFSGGVQFTADIECDENALNSVKVGLAVKWAFTSDADLRGAYLRGADLRGAYLRGADLRGADLRGADLIDGGQRSDGWRFIGQVKEGVIWIHAGCRYFPIDEARKHWHDKRGGTALGDESQARVDLIESIAKIRGLLETKKAA